ncbi:Immunity protein Imm1 [Nonomuraea jiangxiensis]|uniref:Immunity protein Imm1 n=2 Tax=Nonomuraea jiangxiensis TaxID=633440 RepID=A0A1G9UKL1_9ACTN|nr:Immunity protein Imm1 [Nonomuraea jiangxiensis]
MTDHLLHLRTYSDPERAGEGFDVAVCKILAHGGSGQSLWFGPEGGEGELRVDIDIEVGRAALNWLADDTIGIELEPGPPITVMWSIDAPFVTVPGELARVSTATARRAVLEYVATGKRPTCVEWAPEPDLDEVLQLPAPA